MWNHWLMYWWCHGSVSRELIYRWCHGCFTWNHCLIIRWHHGCASCEITGWPTGGVMAVFRVKSLIDLQVVSWLCLKWNHWLIYRWCHCCVSCEITGWSTGGVMAVFHVKSLVDLQVVSWLQYALLCNDEDLESALRRYIELNFNHVMESEDFLTMRQDILDEMLHCQRLVIHSEYSLFVGLKRWLQHNTGQWMLWRSPLCLSVISLSLSVALTCCLSVSLLLSFYSLSFTLCILLSLFDPLSLCLSLCFSAVNSDLHCLSLSHFCSICKVLNRNGFYNYLYLLLAQLYLLFYFSVASVSVSVIRDRFVKKLTCAGSPLSFSSPLHYTVIEDIS